MREVVSGAVKSLQVKTYRSSLWSKWIWWILGASLGLLLIAFLVLEALNKSQRAAKALHQVDVFKEKQAVAKVNAVIAKSEKRRQVLINKANKYIEEADKQLKKSAVLQKQVKKNQEIIGGLRGWDDVKSNIKF